MRIARSAKWESGPTRRGGGAPGAAACPLCAWLALATAWAALTLAGCSMGASAGGKVHIATEPENGVTVNIGDETYGETPLTLEGFPPGRIFIRLCKKGFKEKTDIVDIPEQGEETLTFAMRPDGALLSIESDPPEATVILNGTPIGKTPIASFRVPIGEQRYEVRYENYMPEEKTFQAEVDYRYSFSHVLEPLPAQLEIVSTPPLAKVWINEDPQVKTTPARFELDPGIYRIAVHTEGYIMAEEVIAIEPNAAERLSLVMEEGDVPLGMVLIPAGEFTFGTNGASPDESPQRTLYVREFYLDRFEVTNRNFAEAFPGHRYDPVMANFPATGITFRQAEEYAKLAGKRLPTEIEWEKAARGADGREYPWGNEYVVGRCNGGGKINARVAAVGQFQAGASPYGVMDMAGNVMEWTSGWYEPYPGNSIIAKDYGQVFRVLRGGSYKSPRFDLRCARRHYDRMDLSLPEYGFRCAQDVAIPAEPEP